MREANLQGKQDSQRKPREASGGDRERGADLATGAGHPKGVSREETGEGTVAGQTRGSATPAVSLGTSLSHAQTMPGECAATRAGSAGTSATSARQQALGAKKAQGPSARGGLRDGPSTPQRWGHGSPTTSHKGGMSSSTAGRGPAKSSTGER